MISICILYKLDRSICHNAELNLPLLLRRMLTNISNNVPHRAEILDFFAVERHAEGVFRVEQQLHGVHRVEAEFVEFGGGGDGGGVDVFNF